MGPRLKPRRWFSFCLPTLLLFVVIVAIPLAWVAKERRQSFREHQIADELCGQGFPSILFGGPYDSWSGPWQPQHPQVWWRQLATKVLGERIVVINVLPSEVVHRREPVIPPAVCSFEHPAPLAELTNVQFLFLDTTHVESAAPLDGLRTLKWLSLSGTRCADIEPLAGLGNLERLWLNSTQVKDFTPILGLKKLTHVSVNRTPITKEQFAALKTALPECEIYP